MLFSQHQGTVYTRISESFMVFIIESIDSYKVQSTQEYLSLLWFSSIESIDSYKVLALQRRSS
jgi:hypothetical protein